MGKTPFASGSRGPEKVSTTAKLHKNSLVKFLLYFIFLILRESIARTTVSEKVRVKGSQVLKDLSEDFKFTNNEQDKANMRGAIDITTKSGEKVVFDWPSNGSQNNYFDQWKVGSEKKDGKKKEIQNANDSPSFPMLELSSSAKKASDTRRATENK